MKRKREVWLSLGVSFCVMSAHADVAIGTQVITTGTEIKVLEPGPDLQLVIDGIVDEGPDKPYLIKLGPGVYPITANPTTGYGLVMAPYVSITGSGQGSTILKGAISSGTVDSTIAIVTGASNAALTDLSVENDGGSTFSCAIFNGTESVHETRTVRVTASASGGSTWNAGVFNSGSNKTMTQVIATASGGASNYAVFNSNAGVTMTAVTAKASGGTTNNGGVYNYNSSPTMTEVIARASGDFNNYGVKNTGSSPQMTEVTAWASDGTNNYGIHNINSSPIMTEVTASATGAHINLNIGVYNATATSAPRIDRSSLYGNTDAIHFGDSTQTRISNSQLVGGIDADPDGIQCRDNFDENLADVSC